jgi:hypothetical protein
MNKKNPKETRSEFMTYFKTLTEFELAEFAENFPVCNPAGHVLTVKNIAFLKFQNIEDWNFTVVAGFQQWKRFGRQVKKGVHGFWIFIPKMTRTKVENNGATTTLEDCEGFLMARVFDISQTFDVGDAEKALADSKVPEEAFA